MRLTGSDGSFKKDHSGKGAADGLKGAKLRKMNG